MFFFILILFLIIGQGKRWLDSEDRGNYHAIIVFLHVDPFLCVCVCKFEWFSTRSDIVQISIVSQRFANVWKIFPTCASSTTSVRRKLKDENFCFVSVCVCVSFFPEVNFCVQCHRGTSTQKGSMITVVELVAKIIVRWIIHSVRVCNSDQIAHIKRRVPIEFNLELLSNA